MPASTRKHAAKAEDKTEGRKIKYIGIADRAVLDEGEDFGGRLAKPLKKKIVWDWGNRHIVDAGKAGLSDEALELLLADDTRFIDVSNDKIVPLGLHEKTWKAMREAPSEDTEEDDSADHETGDDDQATNTSGGAVEVPPTP
jgi:hypothetical protein